VYRQLKQRDDVSSIPMPSGRVWRVEQPNVHQREVRAFLTGQVTVAVRKEGSTSQGVARQYTEYDPLSRDPSEIVRALTFHEESGGTAYSGLTNRMLEAEDLSHLLRLGRAILFGRLNRSVADIQLDGQTVSPDREDTFVRIVLPVTQVGDDTRRELEKFEP
jgi:hypothetical protein